MKKRNSLIELYRFLFAMNVVKNHGYFPYQGRYFSPGRISVEFFFVLSGWFLRKTIDKYAHLSFWKGLLIMLRDKFISFGIPFAVAITCGILCYFANGLDTWWDFNIWGHLWYINEMLIVFVFYYVLWRLVKSEKWFFIIAASVCLIASIFHAIPNFYDWGRFRAFSSMSVGILISYIPSFKIKRQWLLYFPLVVVWAYVLRMLLFDFTFLEEEILNYVAYPALIYLTFQLSVHNVIFNYLGALSFGLYAYQGVVRVMCLFNFGNVWIWFSTILGLTILTDMVMRIILYQKNKKGQKQIT